MIAIVFALLAVGYWGLGSPSLPPQPEFRIPIDELRSEAQSRGKADAVIVHVVGDASLPAMVATAWGGLQPERRIYTAFEIVSGEQRIVVDAPHTQQLHQLVPGAANYHPESFERMQAALESSDRIIITHTHGDHVAGIPYGRRAEEITAKLHLNSRQHRELELGGMPDKPSIRRMGFPPRLLALTDRLPDMELQWLAPGVAIIDAPGHTPGHQIVYVALDNHEVLLLGDMVWSLDNLRRGRSRPRAISHLVIREDAGRVADQVAALRLLAAQAPEVLLVPSHDPGALDAAMVAGAIQPAGL